METQIVDKLFEEKFLSVEERIRLKSYYQNRYFSLFWEIRTILYLGIVLFSAGTGILVYKNIDTIGHQTILTLIAFSASSCFVYCFKKSPGFTFEKVASPTIAFDYVLILGCLLFISFEGYLQYKYTVFGTRYGLATIIPSIFFLFCAYRFDSKSVLSMGITGMAAWLGIAITPMDVLSGKNDFNNLKLINSAIALGTLLIAVAFILEKLSVKKHFKFTYLNFALNLLFVSSLAAILRDNYINIYFILLIFLVIGFIQFSKRTQSFLFLLSSCLYGYIGVTYTIFNINVFQEIFIILVYFIGSCSGIIWFIYNYKKMLTK